MRRVILSIAALALVGACGSAGSSKTTVGAPAATTAPPPSTTAAPSTTVAPATTVAESSGTDASATKKVTTLDEAKASLTEDDFVSTTEAGCVIDSLVGTVGKDSTIAIANADDLPSTTKAEQDATVAAFEKCVSKDTLAKSLSTVLVISARESGVTITADQASCAAGKIVGGLTVRDFLVGLGSSDFSTLAPEKQTVVGGAMQACLPPDALTKLFSGN